MLNYRLIFIGLLCCLLLQLKGQVTAIDSLKKALVFSQEDTHKLEIYNEIVKYYHYRSSDSNDIYITQALTLAKDIDNQRWVANFTYLNAINLQRTASRQEAIVEYLNSIRLFEASFDTANLVKAHAALINTYSDIGEVEKALLHYQKGEILLADDDLMMKASLNNRIGIVYGNLKELEVAMRFFRLNLPLFEELDNNHGRGFTHMNIGVLHNDLGRPDSALIYLERGLKYHRLSDKPSAIAGNLGELANFYISQKKYPKALQYVEEAISLAVPLNFPSVIIPHYFSLSKIHQQTGEYEAAIIAAEKGLLLADGTKHYDQTKNLLDILAECSFLTKNYKAAYAYEKRRASILDTLFNESNNLIVKELEQKYQTSQQTAKIELQAAQLSRQRLFLIGIGVISMLVLLLTFQIYRQSQQGKKTNAQLRQLDSAKSRFFANISHELRTPLTLILAPLEQAMAIVKSSTAKTSIKTAHRNGKKLLTLVNEILDLSKLESGKMTIQETPVDLEKLLRRIFFSYQSLAQLREFTLSFAYHLPRGLAVKLDVGKFEKVLNNLLSNAFKYSQAGGIITLRAEKEGKYLKIEVSDTGKGIPTEQLEQIFDRFYQIEDEDEPLQGGTGIGLAYAKEIAHFLGGDLLVESEIGQGSRFVFSLPLLKTTLSTVSIGNENYSEFIEKERPVVLPFSKEKPRILIVEDNLEMRNFLLETLSPDFQCTTAADGEIALKLLKNAQLSNDTAQFPDLITSDIMMPNMDGFTFLEKMHEMEAFRKTPFILLTARAMEEDKLRGFSLGVDDYLTKPFSIKELLARIHNLLKNKQVREKVLLENTSIEKEKENSSLSHEERFLKEAEDLVLLHLSDGNYKIVDFAKELNYSHRQLGRLLTKLTGLSPVEFMREIRLQKAYIMLEERKFATVAEVRYAIGMENASHFTKKFRERFGKNPGEMNS